MVWTDSFTDCESERVQLVVVAVNTDDRVYGDVVQNWAWARNIVDMPGSFDRHRCAASV